MPTVSRGLALAVLALVSATTVASEVLLTRALSVTTWYGLAFVVLSLAMLGLTRGSLDADAASRAGEHYDSGIAEPAERVAKLVVHLHGKAVEPVRTVEGDAGDRARLEQDGLVFHAGLCSVSPGCASRDGS